MIAIVVLINLNGFKLPYQVSVFVSVSFSGILVDSHGRFFVMAWSSCYIATPMYALFDMIEKLLFLHLIKSIRSSSFMYLKIVGKMANQNHYKENYLRFSNLETFSQNGIY